MKASMGRLCRWISVPCWLALMAVLWAGGASAQELVVVVSSTQDNASADKLAELIHEPFERVSAASLESLPPPAAGGCRTQARIELHLDSLGQSVRLIRCRDATVLARGLDPEVVRQTPYLSAFVAAELIAVDRELQAVQQRPQGPITPAAESGTSFAPPQVPAVSAEWLLRAGAELALWGAPFEHAPRPNLGLGLALTPGGAVLAAFAELSVGAFAHAQPQRQEESLALSRHDGALHAGLRVPLGPLQLTCFALLRASLTRAEYRADLVVSDTQLRFGLGVGAQAELPLGSVFSLYLQTKLDVATSRSEYRVAGQRWLDDPASLLWVGLGLLLRVHP